MNDKVPCYVMLSCQLRKAYLVRKLVPAGCAEVTTERSACQLSQLEVL
jgi:hypothetical protein